MERDIHAMVVPVIADTLNSEMIAAKSELRQARKMLLCGDTDEIDIVAQNEKCNELYKTYLAKLSVALMGTRGIPLPLNNFYGTQSQGPFVDSLSEYLANKHVRKLIQTFAMTSAGAYFVGFYGILFYAFFLLNPGIFLVAAFFGGVASYIAFDSLDDMGENPAITRSSLKLLYGVTEILGGFDQTAPIGHQERFVCEHMKRILESKTYREFILEHQETLSIPDSHVDSCSRRLKLIVYSHLLRQELKKLPVVMLCGPTESGKSALREHMVNPENPNRDQFGDETEKRTPVPELFLCKISNERSFIVLDTIGMGDADIPDGNADIPDGNADIPDVCGTIEAANKHFGKFCTARVIVVTKDSTERNKKERNKTARGSSEVFDHPVLTAINKSDTYAFIRDPGISEIEKREKLIKEGKLRSFQIRPFNEDMYMPRCWTCFDNFDDLDILADIILKPCDVKGWIEHHLYDT